MDCQSRLLQVTYMQVRDYRRHVHEKGKNRTSNRKKTFTPHHHKQREKSPGVQQIMYILILHFYIHLIFYIYIIISFVFKMTEYSFYVACTMLKDFKL